MKKDINIFLPLYIKKDVFTSKNLNIIKKTFSYKKIDLGVVFGELVDVNNIIVSDILLSNASHIINHIDENESKCTLRLLMTRMGKEALYLHENNFDICAVIRDNGDNNNYVFYTIDIVSEINEQYTLITNLRLKKLERILEDD